MACKLCKLDHPRHVMCKAWAARLAAEKVQDEVLKASVKPAAELVKPQMVVNPESVKPVTDSVKPRHLTDARKEYMKTYMRAYMAKRRTV